VAWILQPRGFFICADFPGRSGRPIRIHPGCPGAGVSPRHAAGHALRRCDCSRHGHTCAGNCARREMYTGTLFSWQRPIFSVQLPIRQYAILRPAVEVVTRARILRNAPYTRFYVIPTEGSVADRAERSPCLYVGLLPLTIGYAIFPYA